MRYKYLYIIFFSIMFSQSFFNRILPGEVYEGDVKILLKEIIIYSTR